MSATRKRKVEAVESKNLSAIARRRLREQALITATDSTSNSNVETNVEENRLFSAEGLGKTDGNAITSIRSGVTTPVDKPTLTRNSSERAQVDVQSDSEFEQDEEVEINTNNDDNVAVPQVPHAVSQFTLINTPVVYYKDGSILVSIGAGERLVVAGEFTLHVVTNTITILGARLVAGNTSHTVHAFLSHSLPVIRCSSSDCNEAKVRLKPLNSGITRLAELSPLFNDLGADDDSDVVDEGVPDYFPRTTFQLLFSKTTAKSKKLKWPLVSPSEWNKVLVTSSIRKPNTKNHIIMLCGPKSSGKSTFSTLLTNRLLTEPGARKSGVAFLDLDPGQPEYTTPGQLSLMHILVPNFEPPFCHASIAPSKNSVIHSHFVGTITPSGDSDYYKKCLLDLLVRYRNLLKSIPSCPLIINTPGWIQGTGLELLVGIIKMARPTDIIYMSDEGPRDVVDTLVKAAGKTSVVTLPSQAKDYMTRTAANLRTMQMMSYFHQAQDGSLWDVLPLSSLSPLEITYAGPKQGILGILCLGEQPPADLLKDIIDGNLVAIVSYNQATPRNDISKTSITQVTTSGAEQDFISFSAVSDGDDAVFEEVQIPFYENIIRTPEMLPYIDCESSSLPAPHSLNCHGMALIRGIDISRQKLQILTPLSGTIVRRLINEGSQIILMSGKLDTPGWAYTEELNRRDTIRKQKSEDNKVFGKGNNDISDSIDVHGSTKSFEQGPWIEKLSGDGGRGVENRTWRVRRDLGKSA